MMNDGILNKDFRYASQKFFFLQKKRLRDIMAYPAIEKINLDANRFVRLFLFIHILIELFV